MSAVLSWGIVKESKPTPTSLSPSGHPMVRHNGLSCFSPHPNSNIWRGLLLESGRSGHIQTIADYPLAFPNALGARNQSPVILNYLQQGYLFLKADAVPSGEGEEAHT